MTTPATQILLDVPPRPCALAGVPAVVRTALELSSEGRVFLCTRERETLGPWRDHLAGAAIQEIAGYNGSAPLAERLDPASPLLLLSPDGVPGKPELAEFVAAARRDGSPATWVWNGRAVAAYYPRAAQCLEGAAPDSKEFPRHGLASVHAPKTAPAEGWQSLSDDGAVRRAEQRLYDGLRSDADGYLARLDRHLSIALSRRLIRTPVTPNQITGFSLLVGLAGAALLARPAYPASVVGAVLLWACCVLDGCDGEVARLKLLSSPSGARFDVIADNVVHVAIFAAIPLHVRRAHPDAAFWTPGVLLMAGVLLSMFWVWWLILRRPEDARPGAARVYERIASRDFIYLVAVLTVLRRLDWFLWAAALGAHVFWLSLIALSIGRR